MMTLNLDFEPLRQFQKWILADLIGLGRQHRHPGRVRLVRICNSHPFPVGNHLSQRFLELLNHPSLIV